jgi:hypothetical protein
MKADGIPLKKTLGTVNIDFLWAWIGPKAGCD